MRDMEYDPVSDTAIVNPAISGGELNPYLAQWGRFFVGAITSPRRTLES